MAESMIERIARILCTQAGKDPDQPDRGNTFQVDVSSAMKGPDSGPFAWEHFTANALSIIAAMREPTEAMVAAAADCDSSVVADIYAAMIDAALEEGQ